MLLDGTIPPSVAAVLAVCRSCFTVPTFRTFCVLVTGMIAQTRHRTVCGMLLGTGLERVWHHARCHRLFSAARWSVDEVGLALADLIVARLLPDSAPLVVTVDDTLFKRSGRKVFGAAWQHDGAAKTPRPAGFGNCWVVAGLVVTVPFLSRPVCLPVLARLWQPRHTGKIALARQMVELLAARFPDRTVNAVGDAAYVGEHLRGLDAQITWTSRLKVTSVLHELPPPHTGKKGRPRTRGPRLGTPTDLSQVLDWRRVKVRRYGRVDTVFLADRICLWYGCFHTLPVRVVLVWDSNCGPGTGLDRGYGAALVTTDLTSPAELIVERYAARWAIETAFHDARQTLGVGEARNRTQRAVQRTVPFGLLAYTVVLIWYVLTGHQPADTEQHRARARWYTTKTQPSFEDMTAKLRRTIIAHRFRGPHPHQAQPEEIQAILTAWAIAGT
ncbi:transposase [Streptantibioticus rubrisoli]|uniref:Transposase n=1 Tax=Streptantibioticus rubrisoli TaxID=1387313 RepID=A0ABT1PIB9_9ACTN|nr:transposase [Streptantibioticus rubrisoli]MCQ4045116.1 transposase [Streptantibioticus rubrisoli]